MEQSKVDMFMLNKSTLFPSPLVWYIREQMLKMEDEKWDEVSVVQFRNPTIAMLLSLGCGVYGADRFYLGDWLLGSLKLLCTLIIIAAIVLFDCMNIENWFVVLFMLLFIAIVVLWYFIDIFLVMKRTRVLNYNKLSTFLN